MSRAAVFKLQPAESACNNIALQVQTYTYAYGPDIVYSTMRETVYMDVDLGPADVRMGLTTAEARALAANLLRVADQCDEHRARRESLDDIAEQLRDENFDSRCVTFVHPDVIYCAPGQITETAKAHPGKLVIATRDEVPA